MKKALLGIFTFSLILTACNNQNNKVEIKNEVDSLSYGIGISIAKDIKQQLNSIQLDTLVNYDAVILGFNEYFDTTAILSVQPEEAEAVVQAFFMRKQEEQRQLYLAKYKKNIEIGQKFLDENKTKDGVKVLPSGIQYKIVKYGWGDIPTATDTVLVHYNGTLIDGTVFDSSVKNGGKPVQFTVGDFIPGFSEALQNMKVGSKWIVYIPQDLAYGENTRPEGVIEPYSTLIFEIELKKILSKTKKIKPAVKVAPKPKVQDTTKAAPVEAADSEKAE